MKSKLLLIVTTILAIPFLTACETQDDRTLAEAEACINRATAATVDTCVAKVAGMMSADAFMIRCSAHFIAQNITETKLATGFADIKKPTSGGVPSMTYAMSFLLFSNIANHDIDTALSNCSQSGATSLYKIVQLSSLGSMLSFGGLGAGTDPDDLADAIADFDQTATPQQFEAIGNRVLEIKSSFCDNNGSFSNTDICTKVNQAVTSAGGNAQAIGNLIDDYLDNI